MTGAASHEASAETPLRVAVIYHVWPHYREAVMQAMDRSKAIAYDFYGSGEPLEGILHADTAAVDRFIKAPFRRLGNFLWQPQAVKAAGGGHYDALIMLADPNFVSTWVAAVLARWRRTPVLFWGHGWLKPENRLKQRVRRLYFGLSHQFLVYAERGKRLGTAVGFPPERITVVYNSLAVERADAVIALIESGMTNAERPQAFFADPGRPLLICTARLTARCRFDVLLKAAVLLEERGQAVNVLLVGEGPERAELERMAAEHALEVLFFGACHDEELVGPLLYHADLTVSPGKIGLTAMHSLMYGTPAITHGDFDAQMPEVEVIEEGLTGAFFRRDDATSLADAIASWLATAPPRANVRHHARAAIKAKWAPQVQAAIIERAVLEVTGRA
ncbi:glycosyltransferase family 4 protein [Novosphingobium sp. RD2P27]|uniref:Glycosyltransferase family 4 protein n=1 Tax=Novosphingobium kalidii TaxID=3230299 RepID=A0ABV2D0C1_9SPHN